MGDPDAIFTDHNLRFSRTALINSIDDETRRGLGRQREGGDRDRKNSKKRFQVEAQPVTVNSQKDRKNIELKIARFARLMIDQKRSLRNLDRAPIGL